jgi:pimeloyl-ACP methyl ester carboxylesterase
MMADDIAALIETLGLRKPLICGFSDGGNIALELGMRYPDLARALVISGAMNKLSDSLAHWFEEFGIDGPGLVDFDRIRRELPVLADEWQARHSPQGADHWQSLLQQLSVLWFTPLNYTAEDFVKIIAPVLILTGDRDESAPLEDIVEMFRLTPGSELAVLPGLDHFSTVDTVELFVPTVIRFFARQPTPG